RRHFGKRFAGRQSLGAKQVGGEVPIAEAEPFGSAVSRHHPHRGKGFVGQTPTPFFVPDAGQRVHHRVEIRTDIEAKVNEIVSGVDDHRQRGAGQSAREPVRKPRPTHSTGERHHALPSHAYTSSSGGRYRVFAGNSEG